MEISNLTSFWQKVQTAQSADEDITSNLSSTSGQAAEEYAAYDRYIPSNETGDEIFCSDNYNDILSQNRSMMPPPPPPEMNSDDSSTSTTETDSSTTATDTDTTVDETDTAIASSFSDLLNQISSTMRVNPDSILQTMDELGLSASDLYTSDGMSQLVTALNEGASERGLPTVTNLDDSISSLTSYASESADSLQTTYDLSDEAYSSLMTSLDELLKQFLAQYGSTSSDSDSTETDESVSTSSATQI